MVALAFCRASSWFLRFSVSSVRSSPSCGLRRLGWSSFRLSMILWFLSRSFCASARASSRSLRSLLVSLCSRILPRFPICLPFSVCVRSGFSFFLRCWFSSSRVRSSLRRSRSSALHRSSAFCRRVLWSVPFGSVCSRRVCFFSVVVSTFGVAVVPLVSFFILFRSFVFSAGCSAVAVPVALLGFSPCSVFILTFWGVFSSGSRVFVLTFGFHAVFSFLCTCACVRLCLWIAVFAVDGRFPVELPVHGCPVFWVVFEVFNHFTFHVLCFFPNQCVSAVSSEEASCLPFPCGDR